MQFGIIGAGHMGGMLARAFAETSSETVWMYTRSPSKAEAIAADYENVAICDTLTELVARVDVVVLCTKSGDGTALMSDLGPRLSQNQLFVTTISSVDLDRWRDFTQATPVKLIPSLTQTVHKGVLLLSYPRSMPKEWRERLEDRLSLIGRPFVIDEGQIRICSDLASCGPAFLATICKAWAESAARTGVVERRVAQRLLQDMLVGLSALLESGMDFDDVIKAIKIPGGVTERGIESMEDLPLHLFSRLHQETSSFSHLGKRTPVIDRLSSP